MKRTLFMGAVAGLALLTVACGTDTASPGKYGDQAESDASQADDTAQTAADDALGGDPNAAICADGGTPGMKALIFGLQLLAQPNLDYVTTIHNGEQPPGPMIDTDGVAQGIQDYRVLEGHSAPGYRDPKEILDHWQDLNDRMAAMITGASDPTQADIDTYTVAMGDQQELIMSQLDVSLARELYCEG